MDPARQEAIITAAAKACIHFHPLAFSNHQLLLPFWEGPGRPPTRKQLDYSRPPGGYRKLILERIKAGLDDESLSPWTGGFWHGLRLSGAITNRNRWRINPKRPWLIEDLSRVNISYRLSKPDKIGRRRLTQCLAMHLPPKGQDDITVLAGLFSGSRLQMNSEGKAFFTLPATQEILSILDYWAIAIFNKTKYGYGVSPFYASLLIEHMPVATACRVMTINNPAQCPLLPLAYWEVLFGHEGVPMPSRAGALPYACSDISRKRYHWSHKFLHQTAVRLGIAHVSPPMRELIINWRRNREMLYNERLGE